MQIKRINMGVWFNLIPFKGNKNTISFGSSRLTLEDTQIFGPILLFFKLLLCRYNFIDFNGVIPKVHAIDG